MKPSKIVCSIFFENKDVEFINIACILHDPDIVKSSVKFPDNNAYLQTDFTYIY